MSEIYYLLSVFMTSQTTSPTNSGDMLCVYTTVVQLTVITINHPLIATISKEMHAIDRFFNFAN